MERTVPSTASEEIELYLRTYYSLLRSSAEVQIRTLEEAHIQMRSLLHPGAREQAPDMSAFIYSLLRLPDCMPDVEVVVLGQSSAVFHRRGFPDVETWEEVSAPARRRRCFFDGERTLACFIASRSDIDDVLPMLTAYQIEWNKLHYRLQNLPGSLNLEKALRDTGEFRKLAQALEIAEEDFSRLCAKLGKACARILTCIAANPCRLSVQLLSGSLNEYWRATRLWWENIEHACPDIVDRPVYFISSNTHSVVNLLSGYALQHRQALLDFLNQPVNADLLDEWHQIQASQVPSSEENFLYYLLKRYLQSPPDPSVPLDYKNHEATQGILRVASQYSFDLEAQVIELAGLRPELIDPRLGEDLDFLQESDALILNIDYPLGLSAYNILAKIAEQVGEVLGVYVIGKSATLNGAIGDVLIPNVVHDEQSQNTYLFSNSFNAADVAPNLVYGTVLDNQKAVTVRGTFLQNDQYMDVFYREGYTDIEMEAGPYLSAVYEMFRPQRHPTNEIVNLYGLPFDLGIMHYASDTPLSKGRNLGASNLSYYGMDSTYAVTIAILRRIFKQERTRMGGA